MLNLSNIDLRKSYDSPDEEISAIKSYIYQLVNELAFRLGDTPSGSDGITEILNNIETIANEAKAATMFYGVCTTGGSTKAKTVTIEGFDESCLKTGVMIRVKFQNENTVSAPTLNVNSLGARAIIRYSIYGAGNAAWVSWNGQSVVSLTYDGTNWCMNDFNNTVNGTMTSEQAEAATSATGMLVSPKLLHEKIEDFIEDLIGDYVVEKGTSGIWHYRKWNSGIAECWAGTEVTITSWTLWNNLYQGNMAQQYFDYPTGLFTGVPTLLATCYPPENGGYATAGVEMWTDSDSGVVHSKDRTPNIYPLRSQSGTAPSSGGSLIMAMEAKGSWK
ncbi:MAG: hypothetical protein IKG01_07390 [Lachnospiraceae bacterium]|nr:hypothetical protein [Lachnospiraceae bacterium]